MVTSIDPWSIAGFLIHRVYHPSLLLTHSLLPDHPYSLIHRLFSDRLLAPDPLLLWLLSDQSVLQKLHSLLAFWSIFCSLIHRLLPNPSLVISIAHFIAVWFIACSLIHHLLPDSSLEVSIAPFITPWSIAPFRACTLIHRSFHCSLIHRSFDLSSWSIAYNIPYSWSIAFWLLSDLSILG